MDQSNVSMINLYIFNQLSIASSYGVGTYLQELTTVLKNSSINLNVVHLHSNSQKKMIELQDGVKYWYIPDCTRNRAKNYLEQSESYYRNVVYLLKLYIEDKSNLVFHLNYNSLSLAVSLKEAFNCKIVNTVHYSGWGSSLLGNMGRLKNILSKVQLSDFEKAVLKSIKTEQSLYLLSDQVISLTDYMKDILIRHYALPPTKIKVINNGLANSAKSNKDITSLRDKWLINQSTKIIVFVGRMDNIKGLFYLIQSFKQILLQIPDCRLIIAGSGNYEAYLKESEDICTKVSFTGRLDKQRLYELYKLADVGVIPSLFEPFGYVALEMMMHRLPMVVTATSGLNEVVDEFSGLKVPLVENPDSVEIDTNILSENILLLLKNQENAKQFGEKAYHRYLEKYSSETFERNMISFYQSLFDASLSTL